MSRLMERAEIALEPNALLLMQRCSTVAAVVATLIGFVVLVAWVGSISSLLFQTAGYATMKANTAFCIVLCGCASLAAPKVKPLSQFLFLLAGILGLLSLVEHCTQWNLGIDHLLAYDNKYQLAGSRPGLMSPSTASCLIAISLAQGLFSSREKGGAVSTGLVLATFIAGLFSLIMHLYNVPNVFSVQPFTQVAVPTAIALMLLSVSALCAHPRRAPVAILISNTAGGLASRRLIPVCIVLPVLLGWLRAKGEEQGYYPFEFGTSLLILSMIVLLSGLIWWVADTLTREDAAEKLSTALKASEAKYLSVMETATDAIFSTDRSGAIVFANSATASMFGYSVDELAGCSLPMLITDEPKHPLNSSLPAQSVKAFGKRKNGTLFPVELSIGPSRDGGAEANHGTITYIARDTTQRKQAEIALQEHQELTQAILESANDAFIAIDETGLIVDWNDKATETFGWTREEALGRKLEETVLPVQHHEAHSLRMQELISNGVNATGNQRIESSSMHKNGHEFPVEVSIFPVRTSIGTTVCAFIHDITERRKSELSVQAARDEALRASRFKTNFVATMSHEIRTPMNGILGLTEILLLTNLNDKQRDYATTIQIAGNSLLTVINDVLDFSKMEAGKLFLEVSDFEPIKLVESVAELLTASASEKQLSLLTFIDPNLPLSMKGDRGRLRQILMNLVGNAIKFSEHGEILIRASLEKTANSNQLMFAVTDTGVGLSEEEMSSLFTPFVQLEGSKAQAGTGLGLSISKRLTELMKGEIGVFSEKGSGATFWFSVPFEQASAANIRERVRSDVADARILVVDDEQLARDVLYDYLVSWEMRPTVANGGKSALRMLRSANDADPYSVVIVDQMMPDLDGIELGQIIRQDVLLKKVKLVLLTSFDQPGMSEEALKIGFDAYLTKPIKQAQLLDAIATVLSNEHEANLTAMVAEQLKQNLTTIPPIMRDELILVVDDHKINQQVALLLLGALGYEVHIASSGRQALEFIQRVPYTMVLMDCQMPDLDGFDTTRALRKIEAATGAHMPVIAMTAHAIEGSREQCLAAGMDDFLSKPIDSARLQTIIEKWLPLNSVQDKLKGNHSGLPDVRETLQSKFGAHALELFDMCLRDIPVLLENLRIAVSAKGITEVKSFAHDLKGISGTVCAYEMHKSCSDIELASGDADWQKVNLLVDRLENQFATLKQSPPVLK